MIAGPGAALGRARIVGLALAATVACAPADAVPAPGESDSAHLPFVEGSGLVGVNLRRSAVVRALGPAPGVDAKASLLRYPELGLSFVLQVENAGRDPPVLWMYAQAPSGAQTPGGLRIGLPQARAAEILEREYRLVSKTVGPAKGAPVLSMRVTDLEQRTKRELEVQFDGGRVSRMRFDTHPPPNVRDPSRRTLFDLPPALLIVAFAASATALAMNFIAQRAGWRRRGFPGHLAGPVGLAVAAAGLVALLVSVAWLRDSEPYLRFMGIVALAVAGGLGLFGAGIMAQSDSRAFAWPAKAALALTIVAILVDQAGWLPR